MVEPVIEIRGVRKAFGGTPAVRGVDLDIPKGSIIGLIGKNGAGKTTLIKCALGLLRLDEGEIRVFGEPAWTLSAEAKARLGYVPQVIKLYPWMKVRHLIAYTGAFYERWDRDLAARLVRDWEVEPDKKVSALSAGQLQRLAIVLAIGHQPDLLVLDEPVASLDPEGRRSFLRTVLDMVADGLRTVLFSTHITSDLERVADRVAILREGRIIYDGALDDLKDEVKTLSIAAARPLPSVLPIPGMIRQESHGHSAIVTVRGFTPELADRLRREFDATVEVRDLNLEDIFLEMHHA